MKRKAVAVVVCGLLSSCLLAGCSSDPSGAVREGGSGLAITAEIDPTTGRVILPSSRFKLSEYESLLLTSATSATISTCAKEKLGLYWPAFPISAEEEAVRSMWSELGPWTPQMANKYAFVKPATKADLIANSYIPDDRSEEEKRQGDNLSDEDMEKVIENCQSNTERAAFDERKLGLNRGNEWKEIYEVTQTLVDTPEVTKVREDLALCYTSKGLTLADNDDGYLNLDVKEANPQKIDEEQIEIALKVVECKDQVDAVRRVANVWASLEAPIIEEYAQELAAQRKRLMML